MNIGKDRDSSSNQYVVRLKSKTSPSSPSCSATAEQPAAEDPFMFITLYFDKNSTAADDDDDDDAAAAAADDDDELVMPMNW